MKMNDLLTMLREECQLAWDAAIIEMPEIKDDITFEEYVEECRVEAEIALGI